MTRFITHWASETLTGLVVVAALFGVMHDDFARGKSDLGVINAPAAVSPYNCVRPYMIETWESVGGGRPKLILKYTGLFLPCRETYDLKFPVA